MTDLRDELTEITARLSVIEKLIVACLTASSLRPVLDELYEGFCRIRDRTTDTMERKSHQFLVDAVGNLRKQIE